MFKVCFVSNYNEQKILYNNNYCLIYNFDKELIIKKL